MNNRSERCHQWGLSLPECLVVLAVSGLLLHTALPRLNATADRIMTYQVRSRLAVAINQARVSAVLRQVPATICPVKNDGRCSNDWQQPIMVFSDPDRNYEITDNTSPLVTLPGQGEIRLIPRPGWRRAIHFRPDGTAPGAQGHIAFCTTRQPDSVGRLVLSSGGRTRFVRGDPDQRGCN